MSPAEAAQLVGKTERTIRQWIAGRRLTAQAAGQRTPRPGVGPYRWLIDTDDLAQIPGVALNRALLAEWEAQAALREGGEDMLLRLTRVEHEVAELRTLVERLIKDLKSEGKWPEEDG
jgi:hypothetical protein